MRFSIAEIVEDFPAYRVAVVVARGLSFDAGRGPELAAAIDAAESDTYERFVGVELAQIPQLGDWRRAYKAFGVKKTSYRSSVERLVKAVLAGRGLPRVNALVDCYNLISVQYLVPVGADDLAKTEGDICFRRARTDDEFYPLGGDGGGNDPPKAGEVVYADAEKLLCRRWNWYQDARSPVSTETRRAVLTVQGLESGDVEAASAALCAALARHCGARTTSAIASAATPELEFADQG